MPAILSTIISAFTVVISFFRKIFPWINNLTSFLGGFQALKIAKIAALTVAAGVVLGFLFEFLSLLVSLFSSFIGVINSVFASLRSQESGSSAQCFLYWLNQFGFVDGFNLGLAVALPVLSLVLMFLAYKYVSNVAVKIYDVVSRVF